MTALRDLLAEQPVHKVTVDQVADAAGISRRTFFNYYAGIPAVVSEVIGTHAAHVAGVIGDFSPSASPLQRLRELVATVGIPTDLIEWLALLSARLRGRRGRRGIRRTVWAEGRLAREPHRPAPGRRRRHLWPPSRRRS